MDNSKIAEYEKGAREIDREVPVNNVTMVSLINFEIEEARSSAICLRKIIQQRFSCEMCAL